MKVALARIISVKHTVVEVWTCCVQAKTISEVTIDSKKNAQLVLAQSDPCLLSIRLRLVAPLLLPGLLRPDS